MPTLQWKFVYCCFWFCPGNSKQSQKVFYCSNNKTLKALCISSIPAFLVMQTCWQKSVTVRYLENFSSGNQAAKQQLNSILPSSSPVLCFLIEYNKGREFQRNCNGIESKSKETLIYICEIKQTRRFTPLQIQLRSARFCFSLATVKQPKWIGKADDTKGEWVVLDPAGSAFLLPLDPLDASLLGFCAQVERSADISKHRGRWRRLVGQALAATSERWIQRPSWPPSLSKSNGGIKPLQSVWPATFDFN